MEFVMTVLRVTPDLWWYIAGALIVSAALAHVVARVVGTSSWLAVIPVLALAAVVVLTLTPSLDGGQGRAVRFCGTQIAAPLSPLGLLAVNQRSLNVALFVPLGVSVVVARGWRRRMGLAAFVLLVPVLVELAQYAVPALGRSCSITDVVDNLTGAVYGLLVGLTLDAVMHRVKLGIACGSEVRRRPRRDAVGR